MEEKVKFACISFLIVGIIFLSGIGLWSYGAEPKKEYLRIHIRANSNSQADQAVKYKIKEVIVEFLTPFIAECKTKSQASATLNANLNQIENICNATLKECSFSYLSSASVKREEFPLRVYEGVTLEQGFYDALIVELGSGEGDNWWCVVYPPLCFVGDGQAYQYRSKILDVINDFFCKEKK